MLRCDQWHSVGPAQLTEAQMADSILYHAGNRRLQDDFDSRRIADRLESKLARTVLHG